VETIEILHHRSSGCTSFGVGFGSSAELDEVWLGSIDSGCVDPAVALIVAPDRVVPSLAGLMLTDPISAVPPYPIASDPAAAYLSLLNLTLPIVAAAVLGASVPTLLFRIAGLRWRSSQLRRSWGSSLGTDSPTCRCCDTQYNFLHHYLMQFRFAT
jgi:hypothetical protein